MLGRIVPSPLDFLFSKFISSVVGIDAFSIGGAPLQESFKVWVKDLELILNEEELRIGRRIHYDARLKLLPR